MIRREWKPGRHARGDLPRLHVAARAQGPADRDRLRRAVRVHGPARRLLHALEGPRRSRACCSPWAMRSIAGWCSSRSGSSRTSEGLLVLSLITIIMVTDFAFDAFRFAQYADTVPAIAHERAHAPIGGWLSIARRALVARRRSPSPPRLRTGRRWSRCARFLVLLPLGEHFHIVTALPALFFRRGKPANEVPTVDLSPLLDDSADASELKVGARTVADLVWKDALDAFTCTECGRCKDACPAFVTGKPLSMKWVNDSLKHHLLDQREALVAGGAEAPRAAAGAGRQRDQRGHAVGLHDLRLLRGRLPDRTRTAAEVLPAAPAPRDDGRRVPDRAQERVRRATRCSRTRGACPPTRAATGRAGSTCRSSRAPRRWRGSNGCSTSARPNRSTCAGRRSRAPSSRSCAKPA